MTDSGFDKDFSDFRKLVHSFIHKYLLRYCVPDTELGKEVNEIDLALALTGV